MKTNYATGFLEARGISSPDAISQALKTVLDSIDPMIHDDPVSGFTAHEQAVLREGGLRLERTPGRDLVAEGAVRFAALVESSLTVDQAARRLKVTPGRVHQLLSSSELYSYRLDNKRLIPTFQFIKDKLVPNISMVNKGLPSSMHALGIFNWYHLANPNLEIDAEDSVCITPLDWLTIGRDPKPLIELAQLL